MYQHACMGRVAVCLLAAGVLCGVLPTGAQEALQEESIVVPAVATNAVPAAVVEVPVDAAAAPVAAEPEVTPAPAVAAQSADSDLLRSRPRSLRDYNLPGLDAKITLTSIESWEVAQLIEFLAFKGGLKNIVIGKGITGQTTKLKFDDVSVCDALEVVLSVNNLAYEVKGGIVSVMTDAEYKAMYGRSFYDNKQVKVCQLKYADAARVQTMIAAVKSDIGTVVADPITGTVILIDTPDKITEMESVISRTDLSTIQRLLPTETRTFNLQYAKAEDIQPEVSALLSKEAGAVRVDKRTQTLIVTDLPHNIVKVEDLIAMFDRRPRQVFIEAKVVEVSLTDAYSLGINWRHVFDGLDPRFSLNTLSQPTAAGSGVGSMTYNTIVAGGDLQAVLDALKTVGDTKILSNPHVAVLDGQEAKIEVITDQPYKEVQLETGTTNISGVTYLFKKVGVQLAVTPRINDEKMITCKVRPEISSIATWYDGDEQRGTPVIKQSIAETMVMIQDGVTIIIGGMISDDKSTRMTGIPFLGRIPVLGHLFRYNSENTKNQETVVFMTPRIVSGEEPYLRMKDIKKRAKPLRAVGSEGTGKEFKTIR